MADSRITQKALANALKELMKEVPFNKITIADICQYCGMNRKSFYYHFKDKYDLVNWIFETEFIVPTRQLIDQHPELNEDRWAITAKMCHYFYENKGFYSKAFKIKGQNCFSEYFRSLTVPTLEAQISSITDDAQALSFCVDFYADAALIALERWIVEKNAMGPDQFVSLLKKSIQLLSYSGDI